MKEQETRVTVTALERTLVSYDVHARRRTECSLVQQHVFGRTVSKMTREGRKRYRYPGLIAKPGVERLGQWVLMMREEEAETFTRFLAELRIPYRRERIWVEG